MQMYVSMPSFNISASRDRHSTRAQLLVFIFMNGCWCSEWLLGDRCGSVVKRGGTKGEGGGKEA